MLCSILRSMKKHIKLEDNKITYASDELKYILSTFYFGYYANQAIKFLDKDFLTKLIEATTKGLESIGVSWNDIPEDNHDWGVVLEYINKQKEKIKEKTHANRSGNITTTENDGRKITA